MYVYLRPVEIPGALNETGKKSGKKNYNPAARAWHETVVIMRFMTTENVVAIIPDNAAGPYNRRRRRLLFLLRCPRKVREMISILRKIVVGTERVTRTAIWFRGWNNRRNVKKRRRRNFISAMTLFLSDWASGTASCLTVFLFSLGNPTRSFHLIIYPSIFSISPIVSITRDVYNSEPLGSIVHALWRRNNSSDVWCITLLVKRIKDPQIHVEAKLVFIFVERFSPGEAIDWHFVAQGIDFNDYATVLLIPGCVWCVEAKMILSRAYLWSECVMESRFSSKWYILEYFSLLPKF